MVYLLIEFAPFAVEVFVFSLLICNTLYMLTPCLLIILIILPSFPLAL